MAFTSFNPNAQEFCMPAQATPTPPRVCFPQRSLRPGWSEGPLKKDPPLHPYHAENLEDMFHLLNNDATLPAAKFKVEKPICRVVNVDRKHPFAPKLIDREEFVWEMVDGKLTQKTNPSDIVWLRGDKAKSLRVLDTRHSSMGKEFYLPKGAGSLRLDDDMLAKVPEVTRNLRAIFDRERLLEKNTGRGTEGLSFPCPKAKNPKKILAYSKGADKITKTKHTKVTIADLMSYLDETSRNFIVRWVKGIARFLGIKDNSRILAWTLIIIDYLPGCDFVWHIDGTKDFGTYPGFVANLALGEHGTRKYFDLVDMFGGETGVMTPVRQTLQPGDTSVLSGPARTENAHCVPRHPDRQTTLALKIPFEDLDSPDAPEYIVSDRPAEFVRCDPELKDIQADFKKPVYSVDFRMAYEMQQG